MDENTRATSRTAKEMEKATTSGPMATSTSEVGRTGSNTDWEFCRIRRTGRSVKANGQMESVKSGFRALRSSPPQVFRLRRAPASDYVASENHNNKLYYHS